jgi:RNA polymerase sigma factor (TIGR02999 family)
LKRAFPVCPEVAVQGPAASGGVAPQKGEGPMRDIACRPTADPHAARHLLPLVYDDLRQLAACRLAREAPGQMLGPTDLVHEVYLRLAGTDPGTRWDGRAHFFAAAARTMRHILVENARRNRSRKHGGDRTREPLEEAELPAPEPREDLLALDDALSRLVAADRLSAELVQLRYFGGLSIPEAAQVLGISPRTADRRWAYARAWLRREIEGDGSDNEVRKKPWRDSGRKLALTSG